MIDRRKEKTKSQKELRHAAPVHAEPNRSRNSGKGGARLQNYGLQKISRRGEKKYLDAPLRDNRRKSLPVSARFGNAVQIRRLYKALPGGEFNLDFGDIYAESIDFRSSARAMRRAGDITRIYSKSIPCIYMVKYRADCQTPRNGHFFETKSNHSITL